MKNNLLTIVLLLAVGGLAFWLWKTNKQLDATSRYAVATGKQLDDLTP